jgi:exopolysaccharide biosynthesis polyprenyl glycosylphosphotransferase
MLLAGDGAVLAAVIFVAMRIGAERSGWDWGAAFVVGHAALPAILVAIWVALAWANGLYDSGRAPDRWMAAVLSAKVSAQLVVVWALAYFLPPPWTLVRHVAVFFALGAALAMPLWRQTYAAVFSRGAFRRRLLVFGAGAAGQMAVSAARAAPHEFEVLGYVDDDPALRDATPGGVPVLADHDGLVRVASELGATDVVLAVTRGLSGEAFAALMDAAEHGLALTPMPVFHEAVTGRLPVEHIGDHWAVALPLDPGAARGLYRLAKRAADLALGLAGLAVLGLLLPPLALAIKLDSNGPVMYRQVRVGRRGETFHLWKLRTMRADAERDGPRFATADDPRVTRVGRWLRRSRLDELPQAWSVLAGDMSAVGPRPERPEFVASLAERIPFYRARHAVRPGLTGWAAVHQDYAATEDEALERLQYDLYYIKHQSVAMDAYVILRTLPTLARLRGR